MIDYIALDLLMIENRILVSFSNIYTFSGLFLVKIENENSITGFWLNF